MSKKTGIGTGDYPAPFSIFEEVGLVERVDHPPQSKIPKGTQIAYIMDGTVYRRRWDGDPVEIGGGGGSSGYWDETDGTLSPDSGQSVSVDEATIGDTSQDPTSNGEVRRNGSDMKFYSGGSVRNASNIGGGGSTRGTLVSTSDDVQSKLDNEGSDGVLRFESGTYSIGTALSPYDGQTIETGPGIVFEPTGDNRIWDITDVEHLYMGPCRMFDSNSNTTSVSAIRLNGCRESNFPWLHIEGFYDGIETDNTANSGTNENTISSEMRDIRNDGIVANGETHDNYWRRIFMDGDSGNFGIRWNTSGVDGGNVFGAITTLDFDYGWVIRGGQELWIGTTICETASGDGFLVDGAFNRLFARNIWASLCGNNGVNFVPGSGNSIEHVSIESLYTKDNVNHGLIMDTGTHTGYYIGSIHAHSNDTGSSGDENLDVAGTLEDSHIGYIRSYGGNGIVANGTVNRTSLGYVQADDGFTASNWPHVTYSA